MSSLWTSDALGRMRAISPKAFDSLESFLAEFDPVARAIDDPLTRAVWAGLISDRLAYAFAGGYQAALARAFPGLGPTSRACLCATERGGGHPRAIETRFIRDPSGGGVVNGTKTFATMAKQMPLLFVVASEGQDAAGKNHLTVLRIPHDRPGVTLEAGPPIPFAPEIGHDRVRLENVAVTSGDVLEGDGYDRYLKPFRTVEDVHVMAALLGHLLATALQAKWPAETAEDALGLIALLQTLSAEPPSSTSVHLALGSALRQIEAFVARIEPHFQRVAEDKRLRWERDRPLLRVAQTVRVKRLEAARKAIA